MALRSNSYIIIIIECIHTRLTVCVCVVVWLNKFGVKVIIVNSLIIWLWHKFVCSKNIYYLAITNKHFNF